MLKGKRSVSACSLSSCRLRAEALARAFNNRIWPCVWISQKSSAEIDDGMSNGIDNEEEFFDASPSPVELGDESLFCQQHSSAATEAGRAKLYELLQQHANDDATDVFYDVGEEATLNDTACDTCLNADAKESGQVQCESSQNSSPAKDDTYLSNNLNKDEMHSEFTVYENNQSNNNPMTPNNSDSNEININDIKYQQTVSDSPECCSYNFENSCNKNMSGEIAINYQSSNILTNQPENIVTEKEILDEAKIENISLNESNYLPYSNETSSANNGCSAEIENKENIDLPSAKVSTVELEESFLKKEKHPRALSKALLEEDVNNDVEEESDAAVQVVIETGSPSASSDSSEAKPISPPFNRLQVFDDPRPKILRSISLKTGKTPPGTPSRKKIVRFADVLGLDLEDVRHIMSGDVPTVPSSAYTDLNLKDIDMPICEPISEKIEINRRDSSNWHVVQGSTSTNAFYPLFSNPSEQSDFWDRVRQQRICLESVTVSEVCVRCTCRVMNCGYHKKVTARYTVNDWMSYNDIDASYVPGSSNGETDSFAFSIFLSSLNKSLKFALKYEVNGEEYWDNNRNQNYCFGYHGNDPMNLPSPPLPSFQHEFMW